LATTHTEDGHIQDT